MVVAPLLHSRAKGLENAIAVGRVDLVPERVEGPWKTSRNKAVDSLESW